VHYNSTQCMEKALPLILQSYTIAETAPELPPQVYSVLGDAG
jgi:hypothetical protein